MVLAYFIEHLVMDYHTIHVSAGCHVKPISVIATHITPCIVFTPPFPESYIRCPSRFCSHLFSLSPYTQRLVDFVPSVRFTLGNTHEVPIQCMLWQGPWHINDLWKHMHSVQGRKRYEVNSIQVRSQQIQDRS